jgi:hypothetical protein
VYADRVLGQTRNVGGHVSDGHATAGPGVRHFAEETEVVPIASDNLEHGRRSVRR